MMNWNQVVEKVSPFLVKIYTPQGYGTGFLCLYSGNKTVCAIATAQHVVRHVADWQEPLKIYHHSTGKTQLYKENERVILTNPETDSAVILIEGGFDFPKEHIPLLPSTNPLSVGDEVAWLGFPNIEPDSPCFFGGRISARKKLAYLIDGVAIHGVSGGPVLYISDSGLYIVGTVSAYIHERGQLYPGLLKASDVSYFHTIVEKIGTIKEPHLKKLEAEKLNELK